MPCAEGRAYNDADSHVMEVPNWLEEFADATTRPQLCPLHVESVGALAVQAVAQAEARKGDPEALRLRMEAETERGASRCIA